MARQSNEERLVKLETLMNQVFDEVKGMRADIKELYSGYVRKGQHEEDIHRIENQIDEMNKKRWVQNIVSAALASLLTFLVIFFLQNTGV